MWGLKNDTEYCDNPGWSDGVTFTLPTGINHLNFNKEQVRNISPGRWDDDIGVIKVPDNRITGYLIILATNFSLDLSWKKINNYLFFHIKIVYKHIVKFFHG